MEAEGSSAVEKVNHDSALGECTGDVPPSILAR